jgi:hypothetical protein
MRTYQSEWRITNDELRINKLSPCFLFFIRHSSLVIRHSIWGFAVILETGKSLKIVALVGLAGVIASFFLAGGERFWANWILWFLFLLTIGLGSLFIVALEHVVGARWSVPIRRVPEKLSSLVLLMGPAALIALLSLRILYSWTNPESASDPVIAGKAGWLSIQYFSLRVILCVVLWAFAYWILVAGSLRQDQGRNPGFNLRARRFAPLFMVIFAITITVVAFDWISSLEPTWYSDIFGVYVFAGTFLAGLSATTLALLYLKSRGKLQQVGPDHMYSLGGFLFAFLVFWSYIGFAQYLLMWYANLPEEVFWYRERLHGGWGLLLLALAVFHFLVPFFILIPRETKSNSKTLFWTAAIVLLSHWLDLYWMIFPVLRRGLLFGWPEFAFGLLFIFGSLVWLRRVMNRGPDMPIGDPLLSEGLGFRL